VASSAQLTYTRLFLDKTHNQNRLLMDDASAATACTLKADPRPGPIDRTGPWRSACTGKSSGNTVPDVRNSPEGLRKTDVKAARLGRRGKSTAPRWLCDRRTERIARRGVTCPRCWSDGW
jgi:hypothetical protein